MENTQNYLLILEESLNKKLIYLAELSKLTNIQKDIVTAEEFDDEAFSKYLKIDKVELIKCGNGNRIAAEREQWSDGVNTICIRPGVVICYDRNFVTNETLKKHGVRVIEIPSCELSRGRGGPHCMSMALSRRNEK